MAAKPRVLPPTSTKGLYVLSIGLGLLLGVIATWICFWSEDAISGSGMLTSRLWWLAIFVLAVFLLPAWLVGRIIARVHPRFVPNLLASICYAPGSIAGAVLVILHWKADALVAPMGQPFTLPIALVVSMGIAIYGGVASGFVAAAHLSGFLTERFLGRAVITQPGLICWICGYNLGAHTITTCPECGVAFDPNLPPRSASFDFLSFLKRRRRWPLAIALFLALAPLAYSTTTQTIPGIRFLNGCPSGAELRRVMNVNYVWLPRAVTGPGSTANYARPLSHGWWIPDPLDPNTGITVIYHTLAIDGHPRMFITRGCLNDASAAAGFPQPRDFWWVYPGTENVVAKLNSAQAEEIIRARAVPSPLIAALRAKAEEVHWAAQSASSKWPSAEQKVDPAPFFPPSP